MFSGNMLTNAIAHNAPFIYYSMAAGYLAWDAVNSLFYFEEDFENEQEMNEERILRRHLRDTLNPFDCPELSFRSYFRLSRECATDLCNWLRRQLQYTRRHGLSVERQVLIALRFYATGGYQEAVDQDLNIASSQASVSRCVHRVTDAINETMFRNFIKFPTTPEERAAARGKFANAAQPFVGAIGAIDCTHISILTPKEHEEAYVNHKQFHSLNVQMVCDPSFKILNVNARFPGSRHDAFIWNASALRRNMVENYNAGERKTWLIGDSGYPLSPWLLTPITNADPGSPQFRYTSAHCKARSVVERMFGILKGVWGCLSRKRILMYAPATAGRIVNACAVLRNLRLQYNIQPEDDEVEDIDAEVVQPGQQAPNEQERLAEATRIRDAYIRTHFA